MTTPAMAAVDSESSPILACRADRMVVRPGEAVRLLAWSDSNEVERFFWTATSGTLIGRGRKAEWRLDVAAAKPLVLSASVTAVSGNGAFASCSVEVVVDPGSRGSGRPSGRSLLLPDEPKKGAKAYGLYSYLLFGRRPNDQAMPRYLSAISSLQLSLRTLGNLEQYYTEPGSLNATFIPVRLERRPDVPPSAEEVLDAYDFARAQFLLEALPLEPDDLRSGPYLVSTLTPLTGGEEVEGDFLFLDLSVVPPGATMEAFVEEFVLQAGQERFWEARTGARLALRLRATLAVTAEGLPVVLAEAGRWADVGELLEKLVFWK